MPTTTFTDFLRSPKTVAARAEKDALRITRRDAADLVLVSAETFETQTAGLSLASRLMRATIHNRDVRVAAAELFSWVSLLGDEEKEQFYQEVEDLLWASSELGSFEQLRNAIQSWQGTAENYAAGIRPQADMQWFDDLPVVERPE